MCKMKDIKKINAIENISNKSELNAVLEQDAVCVFVAQKQDVLSFGGLFPIKRQTEIDEVSNIEVKKDKYLVWKLLEYALQKSLNVDIKDVKFTKDETGKWLCDKCEFSLSHSKNVVCVAISKRPVGVDIEKINPQKDKFLEKILSDEEREDYQKLKEKDKIGFLFDAWTRKESLFKKENIKDFSIKDFRMFSDKVYQQRLTFSDGEYSLSVASNLISKVNTYVIKEYITTK